MINASTLAQLIAALAGELGDGAQGSTPAGVFDRLESSGAERQAASIATSVAGWSAIEAARQCAPAGSTVTKTWVTGRNPRPSHLSMNGQTVPIDEPFSNGAMWPGDSRVLPASQVANCNCTVEITVARAGEGLDPTAPQPSGNSWSGRGFSDHIRKHGGEYGLSVGSERDRAAYAQMANDVIDKPDAVRYSDKWAGNYGDRCAFYFKDREDVVIVNLTDKRVLTLFKYEEGRNETVTALWHSVYG